VAAVMAMFVGLVGCSQTSLTMEDAYKIGCPSIDATVASGSVANEVALATLKEVRDRAKPSDETKAWLDAAIELLSAEEPSEVSKQTRKLIIQGCKKHGHPLQNLK
jgi:hypothetical protein